LVKDYFALMAGCLLQLTGKTLSITVITAVLLSFLCAILCTRYSFLWNKAYNLTTTHRALAGISALFTFVFILVFVACYFLKKIAMDKITHWSNMRMADKQWVYDLTKEAYYKVKEAGLENSNLKNLDPANNTVTIPVTKDETRKLIAHSFADHAVQDFQQTCPFLSEVIWADSGIATSAVDNDIKGYFGNIQVQNDAVQPNVLTTDDDFSKRITQYNAKSGDIQITLLWNNFNDLDLHCIEPLGEEISYKNRMSVSGGELDVDKNRAKEGIDHTKTPIENVYWANANAPEGNYKILVEHYRNQGDVDPTPFKVRVKINSDIKEFSGNISYSDPPQSIYDFQYKKPVNKSAGKAYMASDAVRLVTNAIKTDLEEQASRVVVISRTILVILFLLIQLIPFGLIGLSAYRSLKVKT